MNLFSKRLSFRKFDKHDFPHYLNLSQNEQVMRYITERGLTEEEARKRYDNILNINAKSLDFGALIVLEKDNPVGFAKIVPYEHDGEYEIGYSLLPPYWGKGYGTEISNTLIEYAVEKKEVTALVGIVDPANEASVRILEKGNFQFAGEVKVGGLPGVIYRRKMR